jgi:hypothetical protein
MLPYQTAVASNNTAVGIEALGAGAITVTIDNTAISGNGVGVDAEGPAHVSLNHSVIQGNQTGTNNVTSNTFYTYGSNLIDFNGNNINGALNSTVTLR